MADLDYRNTNELIDQLSLSRGKPENGDWGRTIFFIGAGCSKSAGIPLAGEIAEECVKSLAESYARDTFGSSLEALKWMYDNEKFKKGKYSDDPVWGDLYGQIFEDHYRTVASQRPIIAHAIAKAAGRINWAHICLGELVYQRYIHTILTTNFDQLALQGIIYAGIFPVVADGLEAIDRIIPRPNTPQIVHLHGSMHTYSPRNSESAVMETAADRSMQGMFYQLVREGDVLVVVGYGGGEEGIMALLIETAKPFPEMEIYWTKREGSALSPRAQELMTTHRHKYVVTIPDADTFFAELMEGLGLGEPLWMQDPVLTLERQATALADTERGDALVRVETYRNEVERIRGLVQREKRPVIPKEVIAKLRLNGNHEEALTLIRSLPEEPTDWVLWQMRADSAYEYGQESGSSDELRDSVKSWQKVLKIVDRDKEPKLWSDAQRGLARTYFAIAEPIEKEEPSKLELLNMAVSAYQSALEVISSEESSLEWARVTDDLGSALQMIGEITEDQAILNQALTFFSNALEKYGPESKPEDWAKTQDKLGGLLQELGELTSDPEKMKLAINAHQAAASSYNIERSPVDFAGVTNNLAEVYWSLYRLTGRKERQLLNEALAAAKDAERAYEIAGETEFVGQAGALVEQVTDELAKFAEPEE